MQNNKLRRVNHFTGNSGENLTIIIRYDFFKMFGTNVQYVSQQPNQDTYKLRALIDAKAGIIQVLTA